MISALDVYAMALANGSHPLLARRPTGPAGPAPIRRWLGPIDAVDDRALARVHGPVLDIGCGPGRHVLALAQRGELVAGIDVSHAAVTLAQQRGALAIRASVFGDLPAAGRWRTALLLDGNIGIGACPALLLGRVASLLAPEGVLLVELAPPGRGIAIRRLRLEHGRARSDWFEWATVAVDAISDPAAPAGLVMADSWCDGGRWFALLEHR